MAVRENDLLVVSLKVHYPEWLNELSEKEFDDVMVSAEKKAIGALASKIYEAEQYWRARRMIRAMGQMSLEDYDV